jgi:hypothetical protein
MSPGVPTPDPLHQLFRRHANHLDVARARSLQARLRQRLFAGEDDPR